MRCLYTDLDGTLLGPDASLLTGADGGFDLSGVRALQACHRAGAEVVLFSGRKQSSVFEIARLIASSAYIFELGCAMVIDGEMTWLTDGVEPSAQDGSVFEQIEATGAPAMLLERFAGRLEPHTPWSVTRDISHVFRGDVAPDEVDEALRAGGYDSLRLVDNGVIHEAGALGLMPELEIVRVYHLMPAGASKARAVAAHMRARGYAPEDCVACGDSREDLGAAEVVGSFWLTANALTRDPALASLASLASRPGVRIAQESYGAGVYEAVVTTLAEGRG